MKAKFWTSSSKAGVMQKPPKADEESSLDQAKQVARLGGLALRAPQPGMTGGGAELPNLGRQPIQSSFWPIRLIPRNGRPQIP